MTDGPLIVQSDKTLLLDVDHILSTECRRAIAPFAELERSPEHIHTYRLTNLGLWNARAAGHDAELLHFWAFVSIMKLLQSTQVSVDRSNNHYCVLVGQQKILQVTLMGKLTTSPLNKMDGRFVNIKSMQPKGSGMVVPV